MVLYGSCVSLIHTDSSYSSKIDTSSVVYSIGIFDSILVHLLLFDLSSGTSSSLLLSFFLCPSSANTKFSHQLFGTPADTKLRPTIWTTIALTFRFLWYRNEIIAVLPPKSTAYSTIFPKETVAALRWFFRCIYRFSQIKSLLSHFSK